VKAALASASYVPPPEPEPIATATAAVSFIAPQPRIEFVPPPPVVQRPPVEASGEEIARDIEVMIQSAQSYQSAKSAFPPLNSAEKLAREVTPESLSTNIRPLGQLDESFIIATDDEGLLLIDQHVAHERVLFDKYRALEAERRTESQQLLVPETFDLTPAQAAVFDDLVPE